MHIGGRQQAQTGVVAPIVIPGKEVTRPTAGIGQAAKAFRVIRAVLERLEL
jgi:hypothetical protein